MKKLFTAFCVVCVLAAYSCQHDDVDGLNSSDQSTEPPTTKVPDKELLYDELPSQVQINFTTDKGESFSEPYNGVRIGEYLWMDNNFRYPEEPAEPKPSKDKINECLRYYYIDGNQYNVSIADINKYFGQYYSRSSIDYLSSVGRMYATTTNGYEYDDKWKLASVNDYRQLYAMCVQGERYPEEEVRLALVCKSGENAAAKQISNTYWYQGVNSNKYKFNLLAGGARLNGDGPWWTIDSWSTEVIKIDGKKGDFHGFFEVAYLAASDGMALMHDYPDISTDISYHWLNMRWCRRFTNKELGYKLYVNSDRTDIVKLGLEAQPAAGYKELENGYLRGFYVQFILDKEHPVKTVAQIVSMADHMPEYTRNNHVVK